MGVRIIKEDGSSITGPEYTVSNRMKKNDYNKMIELEYKENSMKGYKLSEKNIK